MPLITTRSRQVQEIVEDKERMVNTEQEKLKRIRENWRKIREMGSAFALLQDPIVLDYEQGRYFYEVMPDGAWKNQRCFILGGGESLKSFDFLLLKNELVIGVNRAYEKMDCTINFAMDNQLYQWILDGKLGRTAKEGREAKEKFENFKGFPVWLDSVGYKYPEGIYILNKNGSHNLSTSMKKGITGESNSGFGALNLAVCLGANPIYLLGFDMQGNGQGGQAWWHSGYPQNQVDHVYKGFINSFRRVAEDLQKRNIQVINLNPDSALQCFEFGKFEDIEKISRPVITSYYTKDTGYEEQINHLKITLRRFNLDNDIHGIADKGSWKRNTYYKAKFIKKMMNKYPDRSIVFVDADAMIRQNPAFFNNLDCDFACHFKDGKELLSGTLFFGNTEKAHYLVDKWIEEDGLYPRTHMPQKNLRSVFDKYKNEINWKALPVEYCMIFDSKARLSKKPVIEHFQLSRKYKEPKSSRHRYMMKRSLLEIQDFCKDKNICLIGNADSVLRRKRHIDTYDVVCRMNRGAPKGKEKFIGSRTDILFLSTNMSEEVIKKSFDPKFVVWMTVCHRLAGLWTLKNAIQNPREDWHELHKKLKINPSTGMMALNFMLRHIDFKHLTIYGFDFFTTKTWYNTKVDSGKKHSGEKEKILFAEMIKDNPRVRHIK